MTVVKSESNITDKILSPLIKDDKTKNANISKKGIYIYIKKKKKKKKENILVLMFLYIK